MDTYLNDLGQFGAMGLWTLSLLFSNARMRKDFQDRYDNLNKSLLEKAIETHQTVQFLLEEIKSDNAKRKALERFKIDV